MLQKLCGVPTHSTRFGHGPVQALLIHCSLASVTSWGPIAAALSEDLSMTAFDLPGHGQSGDWAGQGEIQHISAQIAAQLIEAPCVLVGHSFGATVALRLALERPELVRGLVLIEPVFFAVALQDDPMAAESLDQDLAAFARASERGDQERAAQEFTRIWGDGTPWEAIPKVVQRRMADQMPLIWAAAPALYDDVGRILPRLDQLSRPVLLLEGDHSPGVIAVIGRGLQRRISSASRVLISGAGHMAPMTHPAAVAREIQTFVRTLAMA